MSSRKRVTLHKEHFRKIGGTRDKLHEQSGRKDNFFPEGLKVIRN